jgi:hypothetical protein
MFTTLWRRAADRTRRPSPDRGQPRSRPLGFERLEDRSLPSSNVVLQWNEILLQSLSTPTAPVPLSRNMALVSVAMYDAINAIDRSYEPYAADVHASRGASQEAAAAQAAHDTLVALYPTRQGVFDAALAESLAGIPTGLARQGVAVGGEVAREILALRRDDGSGTARTWTPPNNDPGTYQLTPPNFAPAGNVHVPFITPYAVQSASQFRPGSHPALDSPEYAADLNEVRVVGASDADVAGVDRDNNGLPDRTADQTLVAELWRVPLGNHTVWNRIAQDQAATHDLSLPETARLFALMNMALNDGLLTSHESKYHYNLWRPITAIQWAEGVFYPDPKAWKTEHPTTPPYPAYASNASTIGAACATVLTDVFGPDVSFQVNWSQGARTYDNFWAAADEQANGRIYGGIHFRFDCVAGQGIGADVGGYILDNFLLPRGNPSSFQSGRPQGAAAPTEGGVTYAPYGLFDGGPAARAVNPAVPDDQASGGIDDQGYASAIPVDSSAADGRDDFGVSAVGGGITVTPGGAVYADLLTDIAADLALTDRDAV